MTHTPDSGPTDEQIRRYQHDLRSPLHAIAGFLELLELRELDAVAREYVAHLREAADRLVTLVDEAPDRLERP